MADLRALPGGARGLGEAEWVFVALAGMAAVALWALARWVDAEGELEMERAARKRMPPVVVYLTPEDFRRDRAAELD